MSLPKSRGCLFPFSWSSGVHLHYHFPICFTKESSLFFRNECLPVLDCVYMHHAGFHLGRARGGGGGAFGS